MNRELMFGNLLLKDNVQVVVDHTVMQAIAHGEVYEKIRVSDHRLEFAGFNVDGNTSTKLFGHRELIIVRYGDVYAVRINDTIARSTITLKTVTYWHELQNLVRVIFNEDL